MHSFQSWINKSIIECTEVSWILQVLSEDFKYLFKNNAAVVPVVIIGMQCCAAGLRVNCED